MNDRGDRAAALLRSAGSRRTPGRIAMISVLLGARPRHLSATELEERLHAAGWRSDPSGIFRAAVMLVARGLLHTLPTPGPIAYGLASPAHHHAICTACGVTIEIPADRLSTAAAELTLRPSGFRPAPDGIAIHGLCRGCVTAERR